MRSRSKCLSARRALRFYRARMAASLRAMGAPVPRLSRPPDRGACAYVRWLVDRAKERAQAARVALERWRHEYAWWLWLPAKWRRIATCETHLDWAWDSGTYVSAFGIYRPGYADDARAIGLPTWDDPGERTPREQFETALSHFRLHGGFSGWGCRGA